MLSQEQIPAFTFSVLEGGGTLRAFELTTDSLLPAGTTVVGRYVSDWHTLPTGTLCIVVSENNGIELKAVFQPVAETALEIWQVTAYIAAAVRPSLVELSAQIKQMRKEQADA